MQIKLSQIKEFIKNNREETINFLCELIKFDSVSGNEGEIQKYIYNKFNEIGFSPELIPVDEEIKKDKEYTFPEEEKSYKGRPNLVLHIMGSGKGKSLIINAHSDVVPAKEWKDAFNPVVKGNKITGRGAVDDKAQIAVMYLLLKLLRKFDIKLKGDLILEVVIEEEVGGNGTLALIRDGYKADGAVVLECADMAIHPANRGVLWFQAEVRGKPIHMGKIYEGVSAIEKAIEFIDILKGYEKELLKNAKKDPLFKNEKQPAQVNIGIIKGGEFPSIVPAKALIEGGIGFLPDKNIKQIKKDIKNLISQKGSEWLKKHYRISYNKLHNEAFRIAEDHPLVEKMKQAFIKSKKETKVNGWIVSCDARLFATVGKMPVIVTGAGNLKMAHTNNETVNITEIEKMAEILFNFVQDWCN